MTIKKIVLILLFIPLALNAQDEGFGFDDSDFGFDDFGSSGSPRYSFDIGGEVRAELTGFFNDFSSKDSFNDSSLDDIFSGNLNFHFASSAAEAVINLTIIPAFDGSTPVEIDEAYVRAFFRPFIIEGGLRKVSWGKADSFGPLDLINPLDFSDLTKLSDPQSIKIARPMIRGIWLFGDFSRLEGIFIPSFQGHNFDETGRWMPHQIKTLQDMINTLPLGAEFDGDLYPETSTLQYAQGGLRFTSSIASSDFGLQYYFGRFPRPAVILVPIHHLPIVVPVVNYNYYHHIGADFARVIAGFNLRAEAAVNLTEDMNGTDGTIENPAFLWSLGFDRDLIWGINLNLQGTGTIRLFHSKINDNPLLDSEAGTNVSSTRITGILSRKFLRDELELKTTCLWGIEEKDFLIMPALIWSKNDVKAELSAGFFGGDRTGELGQYRDNSFFRVILSYTF